MLFLSFFAYGTAPYRGCVGRAMGWRAYCSVGRAEVLRPNGLQFYDSVLLLIAGEGGCAQDDFLYQEVRDAVASESASSRVGNIARQAREQAGISQAGFAEECGMRHPCSVEWSAAQRTPPSKRLTTLQKRSGKTRSSLCLRRKLFWRIAAGS